MTKLSCIFSSFEIWYLLGLSAPLNGLTDLTDFATAFTQKDGDLERDCDLKDVLTPCCRNRLLFSVDVALFPGFSFRVELSVRRWFLSSLSLIELLFVVSSKRTRRRVVSELLPELVVGVVPVAGFL